MSATTRKSLYNVVLSQAVSSSGKFLFAGNIFGDIFCWNLSMMNFTSRNTSDYKTPAQPIIVISLEPKAPVNSIIFHDDLLVVGTVGIIFSYQWNEERKEMSTQKWRIKLPSQYFESVDVNYILPDRERNCIYAGCGDNMVYQIDLTALSIIRSYSGHTDFIHSLAAIESDLYSASEDGTIMLWDIRESNRTGTIEPYTNTDIARPKFGKWQGTVSVTNEWLVCGGGPKPSIWHLRSLQCMQILPFPEKVHCSELFEDLIIIGGEHQHLHQYNFNGDIIAEVPISGPSAYSIALQDRPIKFMSVAGASDYLDIFTSFNFRDMVVKLYCKE